MAARSVDWTAHVIDADVVIMILLDGREEIAFAVNGGQEVADVGEHVEDEEEGDGPLEDAGRIVVFFVAQDPKG